jgi:hypothetical protein
MTGQRLEQERQVRHLELAADRPLGAPADVAEGEAARVLQVLQDLAMLGHVLERDALGGAVDRRFLHERQRLGRHLFGPTFLIIGTGTQRMRHERRSPSCLRSMGLMSLMSFMCDFMNSG